MKLKELTDMFLDDYYDDFKLVIIPRHELKPDIQKTISGVHVDHNRRLIIFRHY